MFGNIFNAAVKAVQSFFGGGSKPAPKPAPPPPPPKPVPPKLQPLPAVTWMIPTWQEVQSGRYNWAAATAHNNANVARTNAAVAANQAQLRADAIERQRIADQIRREQEERERKRREKQAALDAIHNNLKTDRQNRAQGALEQLAKKGDPNDWHTYFDDSGNFKGKGYKDSSGFQIPDNWYGELDSFNNMRNAWSAWYNSDAGLSQRTRDEYKKRAQKIIDDSKKAPTGGFLTQLFDKITFGGTRRAMDAREQAAKMYQETMKGQVKKYEESTNNFLKEQAARSQELQTKKFSSWAEYNDSVKKYKEWEDDQLKTLEYARAATTGSLEGYDSKSREQITNLPGKIGNWLHSNVVNGPIGQVTGNIWKYTLGSGDQNIPSIVTAPARAMNSFTNLFRKQGDTIYDKEGNASKYSGNPWTASFNQSNLNGSYAATTFDNYARNRYLEAKNPKGLVPQEFQVGYKPGQKQQSKFDQAEFDRWKAQNRDMLTKQWQESESRGKSSYLMANDLALDPLSYAGFAAKALQLPARASGFVSKATEALSKTKIGAKAGSFLEAVNSSKPVSWLKAEAKTPQQRYIDTVREANVVTDKAQAELLPRIRARQEVLAQEKNILKGKFDDSILDDFRIMAEQGDDQAAKWLQEMKNGEFSTSAKIKNWTRAGGVGSNPRLAVLKDIADRWSAFSELQRKADKVTGSRFGKGMEQSFYSPRTRYVTPEAYDFRKFKKNLVPQSAQDLYRGAVDRYFKSDVIDYWGDSQKAKIGKIDEGLQSLLNEYDTKTGFARDAVEKAFAKTQTPYGKLRGFTSKYSPTSLWKKSVLKYRPAWYVNNFLYNTQGAALAGGLKGVGEQFRLMRPKNYRAAMAELPSDVRTQVASEIGDGKIAKFGNAVENVSRMGAYRALIADGLTHKEALKRVNSYLFDYSTKNYERPLKAVMPFYSFQKGLAKSAVKMPFDRPGAAIAYNRVDQYQQQQFEEDFKTIVPKLKDLGYSDEEISQIHDEQSKYYKGRLKVGDNYITTPFNAFSEKGGFAGAGVNPWLSVAAETASAKDSFNRPLSGADANIGARLLSKFPQADLAKKGLDKFLVATGKLKPEKLWIGEPGSEGYGMTKRAQGYDSTQKNYQQGLDPAAKFNQDLAAFFGVPRGMKFDGDKILERKKLEKVKTEYFSINWKDMPFEEREQKRNALFKKYGLTSDQFYDGELSKYDTENTKRIKVMKEDAFNKTKKLFDEYSKQPVGTRGVWATKKLKELVDAGYFKDNPFLKSFDWLDPGSIQKAYKKMAYDQAKSSGDWSSYNSKYGSSKSQKSVDYAKAKASGNWSAYTSKYGSKFAPSAKKIARDKAVATGNWSEYAAQFGVSQKETPYRFDGKYFKSAESMEKYKEGQFWRQYAAASKSERRQLLRDNPQYNRRSGWTNEQWDQAKAEQTALTRAKAARLGGFTQLMLDNLAKNNQLAAPVITKANLRKNKKVAFITR